MKKRRRRRTGGKAWSLRCFRRKYAKGRIGSQGNWAHAGGGCFIKQSGMKHPCDDEFIYRPPGERWRRTKEYRTFTVYTTFEAHFSMPTRVRSKAWLLKHLDGVAASRKLPFLRRRKK